MHLTTTWVNQCKYWLHEGSTTVGYTDATKPVWFIKSDCSDPLKILKQVANKLQVSYMNLIVGIDPQINCDIQSKIGFSYVSYMSDCTLLLSYREIDGSYRKDVRFVNPVLDVSVIDFFKQRTCDLFETATKLIDIDNKLFMVDKAVTGSMESQSVDIDPSKYIIHSHLSNYYDKYGIFISSPSLADIEFVIYNTYSVKMDTLFTASKEGIWSIRVNNVYRDSMSDKTVRLVMKKLVPVNALRKDNERSITDRNRYKIDKLFQVYSSITGKLVGINIPFNNTPILSIRLIPWP